jgi:hypothetical protein
MGLSTTTRA